MCATPLLNRTTVAQGYSSTAIALALPEDGFVVTCDRNAETMAVARDTWASAGVAHKVVARLGPALETLDSFIENRLPPFDICFIDADKRAYGDYFDRCMLLVRVGGLIAVDNTLWYGKVADPEVQDKQTAALRLFNARVLAGAMRCASLCAAVATRLLVALAHAKRALACTCAAGAAAVGLRCVI